MSSKKILLFVLFMSLFVGFNLAQNKLNRVLNGVFEIPKTTIAPVIDCIQDSVWKTLDWNFLTSYNNNNVPADANPDDWADLTGATKMMYDDDNLYCLFFTQDNDPAGNDAAVVDWQRNAVEIYLDGDNSKLHSVVAPDHHLTFRHEHIGDEANSDWDVEAGLDTSGIEWKFLNDENMIGYWLEFKVPLEAINMPNTAGSVIGLEFQQDDNDGSGREAVSKWFLQAGDSSWQYATTWGLGILSDRVVNEKFEIMKVPAGSAPTVDGELDPVFLKGTNITQNHHGNATLYPDDFSDALVRTYLLYDDDNLYGFFYVNDDDPAGNDVAVVDWQRNAVEIYLDGDDSKLHSVVAPDHHLSFRHQHIGDEVNSDWDIEAGLDSTAIEWIIKDRDAGTFAYPGGYNVEFKIPLEALNMPNTPGSPIGLEVQMDDNDGAGRDHISKWALVSGDSSWQYASTWGEAILGGEIVVGIKNVHAPVPTRFSLAQNYPNPFNPTTKISFSIENPGLVTLKVYSLLGQEVATIVNEQLSSGTFEVNFDASNLPSGVYFYKVTTGNTSVTKKMMLLK